MTGALVGVLVHRPALAIPLAFFSHFAVDALPHYGYGYVAPHVRDQQKHFLRKQTVDTYLALFLSWYLAYSLRNHQTPVVMMFCMLAACVPDAVWAYQYILAHRRGSYMPHGWFARLHKRIQWCERSWGFYVELAWLAIMALGMRLATL